MARGASGSPAGHGHGLAGSMHVVQTTAPGSFCLSEKQLNVFARMALQSEVNVRTETAEEHTSDPLIHGTKQMFTQVQMKQVDN